MTFHQHYCGCVNLKGLLDLLIVSRCHIKSPEILLILLTCPLLQEDSNVMNGALRLAVVIGDLSEKTLTTLRTVCVIFLVYRKEFVAACVNHAFNKSVERIFELFRRGFFKVCNMDVVEFFQSEELQTVMVGQENYDWEVFKEVA
ncbi:hypothetical protein XENOCAPTIV_006059 [Xenoophorus captivus]|uniref:HECT domain-containing protein n=1 Tax=Xenoophorus captivus TaxID=1517983 RepID=A0ABV0RY94_9TELE